MFERFEWPLNSSFSSQIKKAIRRIWPTAAATTRLNHLHTRIWRARERKRDTRSIKMASTCVSGAERSELQEMKH